MRWILGLLVLINVGILIWGSLDDDQPTQAQLAAPGVGSIRLVGEPEQAQPQTAVPIPAPPRSNGVMAKAPLVEEAVPTVEVEPAAPAEPEAPVVAEESVPDTAAQETSMPTEPAKVAAVAVPEAESVALTAEPSSQPKPARPRFCSRIGPFAKAEESRTLAAYLEQRGGKVSLREETRSMHAGYWVMIPPHSSKEAAKLVADDLKRKGVKDLWIIPNGEYQYAISLGVFSKQPNAATFAKRVASKGFRVNTVDKLKERTAHWLSYEGEAFIPPTEVSVRVPAGIRAEDQDCP